MIAVVECVTFVCGDQKTNGRCQRAYVRERMSENGFQRLHFALCAFSFVMIYLIYRPIFLDFFAAHDRQRVIRCRRMSDSCSNLRVIYIYMTEKKEIEFFHWLLIHWDKKTKDNTTHE